MRNPSSGKDERGNLERLGESAGAMAGRAADVGMEVTGALFRSAAEMLGGWWSSDAPRQLAGSWNESTESRCRSHFQASASATDTGRTGHVAPKSTRGAMQTEGQLTTATDGSGAYATGSAGIGDTKVEGAMGVDSASDGFARARPGYQLGYVARQNPAYRGRSFGEVEPELQRVWESRAKTQGGESTSTSSWPEVRGFVDFAYQQGDSTTKS